MNAAYKAKNTQTSLWIKLPLLTGKCDTMAFQLHCDKQEEHTE